jgi:hypothetical protein
MSIEIIFPGSAYGASVSRSRRRRTSITVEAFGVEGSALY